MADDKESENSCDDSASDCDAPEENFTLCLVEDSLVEEQAEHESTPASKDCCTELSELEHDKADDESNNE